MAFRDNSPRMPFPEQLTGFVGGGLIRSRAAALLLVCAVVGIAVVFPRTARSQPTDGPGSFAVFKLEGADDSAEIRRELTSVLREEIERRSNFSLVNEDPVLLSDAVVVLGCDSVSTSCLGKAADHFGADFLIYGKVEDVRGRKRVSVRLFDPAKGKYVKSFGRVITKMSAPYDTFRDEVATLLGAEESSSTSASPTAKLRVRSNVDGATVQIDGSVAGKTPLDVEGLDPGQHRVRVDADDYEPWDTEIDVEGNSQVQIRASLTPADSGGSEEGGETSDKQVPTTQTDETDEVEPAPSPERETGSSGGLAAWGPWITIGGGALAFGGATAAYAEIKRAENDLEEWRNENGDSTDACETQEECEIVERGVNAQTAHHILLGVGGVSVASGLIWLGLRTFGKKSSVDTAALRRLEISVTGRGASIGWRF